MTRWCSVPRRTSRFRLLDREEGQAMWDCPCGCKAILGGLTFCPLCKKNRDDQREDDMGKATVGGGYSDKNEEVQEQPEVQDKPEQDEKPEPDSKAKKAG